MSKRRRSQSLARKGTYLGGPLCANSYKLQKIVLWFAQAKLSDSLIQQHIPGWCHLYVAKSYVATKTN